jgi:hypothetical protein
MAGIDEVFRPSEPGAEASGADGLRAGQASARALGGARQVLVRQARAGQMPASQVLVLQIPVSRTPEHQAECWCLRSRSGEC